MHDFKKDVKDAEEKLLDKINKLSNITLELNVSKRNLLVNSISVLLFPPNFRNDFRLSPHSL